MPPLRERPGDIPLLVDHFIQKFAQSSGKTVNTVEPRALAALGTYPGRAMCASWRTSSSAPPSWLPVDSHRGRSRFWPAPGHDSVRRDSHRGFGREWQRASVMGDRSTGACPSRSAARSFRRWTVPRATSPTRARSRHQPFYSLLSHAQTRPRALLPRATRSFPSPRRRAPGALVT